MRCICGREIPVATVAAARAGGFKLACRTCGHKSAPAPELPVLAALPPEEADESAEDDALAAWFAKFDREQSWVYDAFKQMARELRGEGHAKYGGKTIMERLRWESPVRHKGLEFKLSNKEKDRCTARYVRKLIAEEPAFARFFEVRELTYARKARV